ncbi:MAG TPA: hypothetical protein VMB50_01720, partial [Myxococcales bacterium]|nr:hypothetical protein [Myxococcales bacterium]
SAASGSTQEGGSESASSSQEASQDAETTTESSSGESTSEETTSAESSSGESSSAESTTEESTTEGSASEGSSSGESTTSGESSPGAGGSPGSSEGSDQGEATGTEASAAAGLTPYTGPGYSADVPTGWDAVEDDAAKSGYRESKWKEGGHFLLIDTQPAAENLTLEQDAAPVHAAVERIPGYEELRYGPTTLAGSEAWEWVFRARGKQQVDYFFNRCDRGFGVLGSAPGGDFEPFEATFRRAAESVQVSC